MSVNLLSTGSLLLMHKHAHIYARTRVCVFNVYRMYEVRVQVVKLFCCAVAVTTTFQWRLTTV